MTTTNRLIQTAEHQENLRSTASITPISSASNPETSTAGVTHIFSTLSPTTDNSEVFSSSSAPILTPGQWQDNETTMLTVASRTTASDPEVSLSFIGGAVGGIAGSLLLLTLFILVLLALVWITRQYKRAVNLHHQHKYQLEVLQHQQQQLRREVTLMEASSNLYASGTTTHKQQIPTQDNVAYGKIGRPGCSLNFNCDYDYI